MTTPDATRESPISLARRLIARREYEPAIELMRAQMQGRTPTALMRLQFADVLLHAGRGTEAVPVLISLADEFAADGYVARAIAVLKRVDAVAPEREDVGARLSLLVERQHRLAAAGRRRGTAGAWGMEAFSAHPEPELPRQAPPSPRPQPQAPVPEPAEDMASRPRLGGRVKGVFRRFLASISGVPPEAAPSGTSSSAPAGPPAEAASTAPGGEGMSEAAFEEKVLDLVQEIVTPPAAAAGVTPAAEAEAGASWDERERALDRARRLVAIPLFAELSEEELLAVVRGLQLLTFEPGQVVITEGETGQSLFVITSGAVKVFVRNPSGRDVEVCELGEGDFFGEISSLSGRPRTATVTAAAHCEMLELDKATVDSIARMHRRVRDMLDAAYVERLGSPEALAARQVAWSERTSRGRAAEVLQESFGEAQWTPRTRLRLADALFKAGREEEVVAVLLDCVDDLTREGFPGKAVALLKKIERIQRRHIEEVNLAPILKVELEEVEADPEEPAPAPDPATPRPARPRIRHADHFDDWLLAMARQAAAHRVPPLARAAAPRPEDGALAGYLGGLRASPLLQSLSDDELAAVVQAFVLVRCAPGHVVLTEGEPGQSVFVLASGSVRVFVRDAGGRNVEVAELAEGAFFGEMATLSSRPRSATVTAAAPCELLELNRAALDALCAAHPRVRETMEEFYIARASARGARAPADAP
jgi:CRP-like cAMP-binding protein